MVLALCHSVLPKPSAPLPERLDICCTAEPASGTDASAADAAAPSDGTAGAEAREAVLQVQQQEQLQKHQERDQQQEEKHQEAVDGEFQKANQREEDQQTQQAHAHVQLSPDADSPGKAPAAEPAVDATAAGSAAVDATAAAPRATAGTPAVSALKKRAVSVRSVSLLPSFDLEDGPRGGKNAETHGGGDSVASRGGAAESASPPMPHVFDPPTEHHGRTCSSRSSNSSSRVRVRGSTSYSSCYSSSYYSDSSSSSDLSSNNSDGEDKGFCKPRVGAAAGRSSRCSSARLNSLQRQFSTNSNSGLRKTHCFRYKRVPSLHMEAPRFKRKWPLIART